MRSPSPFGTRSSAGCPSRRSKCWATRPDPTRSPEGSRRKRTSGAHRPGEVVAHDRLDLTFEIQEAINGTVEDDRGTALLTCRNDTLAPLQVREAGEGHDATLSELGNAEDRSRHSAYIDPRIWEDAGRNSTLRLADQNDALLRDLRDRLLRAAADDRAAFLHDVDRRGRERPFGLGLRRPQRGLGEPHDLLGQPQRLGLGFAQPLLQALADRAAD